MKRNSFYTALLTHETIFLLTMADSKDLNTVQGTMPLRHHHHHHHHHHSDDSDETYVPHLERPRRVKRIRWMLWALIIVAIILVIDLYIFFLR